MTTPEMTMPKMDCGTLFVIDHGMDNYTEVVDLSQLQAIRASWTSHQNGVDPFERWTVKLYLVGREKPLEVTLNPYGYDSLIEHWTRLRGECKEAPKARKSQKKREEKHNGKQGA